MLSWWVNDWGMTVATDFHLVLRLRMSGVVPLLLPYAFTGWTATPNPPLKFMQIENCVVSTAVVTLRTSGHHLQGLSSITAEDGTNRLSRNVGNQLPIYAA